MARKRVLTEQLVIRVSDDERAALERVASERGTTIATVIRQLIHTLPEGDNP